MKQYFFTTLIRAIIILWMIITKICKFSIGIFHFSCILGSWQLHILLHWQNDATYIWVCAVKKDSMHVERESCPILQILLWFSSRIYSVNVDLKFSLTLTKFWRKLRHHLQKQGPYGGSLPTEQPKHWNNMRRFSLAVLSLEFSGPTSIDVFFCFF